MTAAAPSATRRARNLGSRVSLVAALLFWIVLPVVCIYTITAGANRLASHVNHIPSGVRGTFVVTTHNCQQELCITGGTFTSNDKSVVARDLLGPYRWKLGTSHKVVYSLDAADVIQLPAHWDPTGSVLGIAGSMTLLAVWGWCLRAALRRRRHGANL